MLASGDPVSLLVEKSPANFPTKYIAKQVLVSENTATVLEKALESPANANSNILKKPDEKGITTDWMLLQLIFCFIYTLF